MYMLMSPLASTSIFKFQDSVLLWKAFVIKEAPPFLTMSIKDSGRMNESTQVLNSYVVQVFSQGQKFMFLPLEPSFSNDTSPSESYFGGSI